MPRVTKVKALLSLMNDNEGAASWNYIYDNIEKYYPNIKVPRDWQAALRGVLYRELRNNRHFKRIGLGVFALLDYQEKEVVKDIKTDKVRMHSYIEGLLVELGNYEKYDTYCADRNAVFQSNIRLGQLTSVSEFPEFTYPEIVQAAKRIDVVWFNKDGYKFPKRAIEVVNSIGTLEQSMNRMYQLKEFRTDFMIVSPKQFSNRIDRKLLQEPYLIHKDRFSVIPYENVISYYESTLANERLKF